MAPSETTERILKETYLNNLKTDSEREIKDEATDYTTRYYALHHLRSTIKKMPGLIDTRLIFTLQDVLKDTRFSRQRQSLFYYRIAAEALSSILIYSRDRSLAECVLAGLKTLLSTTTGNNHRATAEAMGLLPLALGGPDLNPAPTGTIPRLTWQQVLSETGIRPEGQPVFLGRSIATRIRGNGHLLVFKLARAGEPSLDLVREARWMACLGAQRHRFPLRFNIPDALKIRNADLFRFTGLPWKLPGHLNLQHQSYAIGFVAHRDYFQYPNHNNAGAGADKQLFMEVMLRNAWLLGRLSSMGIVHTAPIALFHNRVQVHRRRDRGLYEWFRAGRLDRWLESCFYPNIGATGIRDFEHFISFKASDRRLYRFLGNHFLSLLLIAGSYFRNREPQKTGLTSKGEPMDTRYLFDRAMLADIIHGIFDRYYEGFVGRPFEGKMPLNIDELSFRMVEEMGVDRHMQELLRIVDQTAMTDAAFRTFLCERGYTDEEITGLKKGQRDLLIQSGPHLGGFNEQISLPELIKAVATMSALCIAGKFWQLNFKG
ncbi:MAG: SidJ-related pseudokinase [Deltaproteobacteria bacterium]|nr:SidJ-related pseudokinase [Deltaproteobacteria bacterium]